MYCSKCGMVVADSAAFCSACGQPTPAVGVTPVAVPVSAAPSATSVDMSAIGVPAMGIPVPVQIAARAPVLYAGFWLRFVALIIDSVVMWILGAIIAIPLMGAMGVGALLRGMNGPYGPYGPGAGPAQMFPFVSVIFRFLFIGAILKWLYYSLLESSSWQATLGKKALGLEVTDMDGHRISFGRATGRTFAKIISAMIAYVGFMMAGFTDKKQALHDMIAGCLVIKKI